jgi:hypothetical protein
MASDVEQSFDEDEIGSLTYAEEIRREADNEVGVYRDGYKRGKYPTLETKQMIESIVATDYDGRTLIELLQNAHDAHAGERRDGKVLIKLDPDIGEHGTLYVANSGQPFRRRDFQSICRVALSSKRPDESIGNKGVGFKSVLQLSTRPSVFSKSHPDAEQFDGYCFRFADDADIDAIAARVDASEAGLADRIKANISNLKLPVPAEVEDPFVAELAASSYSSVVVLPFRSETAAEEAKRMIEELLEDEAPFNLFLDRLATIRFLVPGGAGGALEEFVRQRSIKDWPPVGRVEVQQLWLNDDEYYRFSTTLNLEDTNLAIEASRRAGRIGANWIEWKTPPKVSIAVPVEKPTDGRLYTFLPMDESATAPLGSFVNAPFFSHLNRRDMEGTIPLNSHFLNAVAQICADILAAVGEGTFMLPNPGVFVDLLAWSPREVERLAGANWQSSKPSTVCAIPTIKGEPTSISSGWIWTEEALSVVNAQTLISVCDANLIDNRIGDKRLARLSRVARALGGQIEPGVELIVVWAEIIAQHLVKERAAPETWADFYDDLAQLLPNPTTISRPPRVILDEAGDVLRDESEEGGPAIFFNPQASDESDVDIAVPSVLRRRLRFTSSKIPHRSGKQLRPGREWLAHASVQRFESTPVLRLVGEVGQQVDNEAERWHLLRFAYDLWAGAREKTDKCSWPSADYAAS